MKSLGLISKVLKTASAALIITILAVPTTVLAADSVVQLQTPFYEKDSADTCSTPLTGSDNMQQAFNYYVGKGLPKEAAAGIVGNFRLESNVDPTTEQAPGASWTDMSDDLTQGHAVGIAQWDGSRRPALINFLKAAGLKLSDMQNGAPNLLSLELDFSWHELTNVYKGTYAQMKQETDVDEATKDFLLGYENGSAAVVANPEIVLLSKRQQYARDIFSRYGDSGQSTGTQSGCGSVANGACRVVYEGQYSQEQLAQIFGDPGTADSHPALKLESVTFMGSTTSVSPLVAPCLKSVESQIKAANIGYEVRMFGCYRFDQEIGFSSYHTYGAACDLNWDTNPEIKGLNLSPPCNYDGEYDMPQEYVTIFQNNGFTWGGEWCSLKDYMHFEWHGVIP